MEGVPGTDMGCERKRLNGPGCKCSTRVVKQDGRTGVGAARELFCLPRLLATPRFRRSHGDGGRADALPQFPSHFLLPPLSFLHRHRHRRLSLIYLESLSSYSSAACPSDHRCGSAPTSRLNPRSHPRHTRRQPQPRSTARPPWTPAPGPRPSECPTATSATPRWSSSASTAALPEGTRARPRHRPRTSRGAAPTGPSSCSPAWSPRASSSDGRCSSPSLRHTSRYYWLPTAPQFFFPDSGILTTPRLNCQDRGKIRYLARNLTNTTQITARLADTAAGFVWIPQYYAKLNCLRPVVMSHTNAGMMIKMYCNNHLGRPVSMIFLYHAPTSHFCHVFTCCSFLNFVQTLGIDHAMASFIWLCGPITGFVVSHPLLFFLPWVIVRIRAMLMCCLPRFNLVLVFGVISAVQSMGGEDHLFWLDA